MEKELSRFRMYFLELIKSVILNEKVPEPYDGVDWDRIYMLSVRHSISNIIAYAIDALDTKVDAAVYKKFDNYRNAVIVQEAQQEIEFKKLINMFEDKHIKNMPVKGCVMKKLYPLSNMRSMCDIDILVDKCEADTVEEMMRGFDYPIKEGGMREIVYKRPPFISVELHLSLVSEKYQKVIYDYYENIWNRAVLKDDRKYTYEISKEDFYVYMIVHIAKHYMSGGAGIRSIVDVYVFMNKYKKILNFEYINAELKKLDLYTFAENILMLTEEWFAGREKSDIGAKMTQYIFMSGTYGCKEYNDAAYALRINEERAYVSSIKKALNIIFLPYENMCVLYPKLKKRHALLPVYWIIRGFDKALHGKGYKNIKAGLTNKATSESIASLKKHLSDVGLN